MDPWNVISAGLSGLAAAGVGWQLWQHRRDRPVIEWWFTSAHRDHTGGGTRTYLSISPSGEGTAYMVSLEWHGCRIYFEDDPHPWPAIAPGEWSPAFLVLPDPTLDDAWLVVRWCESPVRRGHECSCWMSITDGAMRRTRESQKVSPRWRRIWPFPPAEVGPQSGGYSWTRTTKRQRKRAERRTATAS